jgi:hypothetical protein
MKTIIAGGRDYKFTTKDIEFLDSIKNEISEVVCGEARGADTYGKLWAKSNNIPVKSFPANWDKFGKSAGYKRNQQMAQYSDSLVIFPGGKGTEHMFNIATEKGLKIIDLR